MQIPLTINPVKPAELHKYWGFLERGLKDICRRIKPDWLPPDVYGAIRAEVAAAAIICQGSHRLGFVIHHRQEQPWSHTVDLFIWAAWRRPPRECLPSHNIAQAWEETVKYLRQVQNAIGARHIVMITSRKGFYRKYGYKQRFITYEV